MTVRQYIILFLKGLSMGIVNVLPVSSGTISLIVGVFERFINSVKSLNIKAFKLLIKGEFSEFARYTDIKFLSVLLLGIFAGMILTAVLLKVVIKKYEIYCWAFFIGLILASVVYVMKTINKVNVKNIIILLIGVVISFYLSIKSNPYHNDNFFYLVLCGLVGSTGMVVPGISGSHLMLLMGNYELIVTEAIPALTKASTFAHGMSILFPFCIGAVVSIVTISYILSRLMRDYRDATLSALSGFMLGSLPVVYPWKVPAPDMMIYHFSLPPMNKQFVIALLMALLGAAIVFIFDYFAKRKQQRIENKS